MLMQPKDDFIHDPDGVLRDPLATIAAFKRETDHRHFTAWLRSEAVCSEHSLSHWHVLSHRRKSDESLVEELVKLGIEAFSPVRKQETRKGKKRKTVITEHNAMPGYLFIRLPQSWAAWLSVTTFDKVNGLLGRNGYPFIAHRKDVERFQAESAVVERASPLIFSVDNSVRIRSGPFAGFNARVAKSEDGCGWLKVETHVFGRETLVDLHVDMLDLL